MSSAFHQPPTPATRESSGRAWLFILALILIGVGLVLGAWRLGTRGPSKQILIRRGMSAHEIARTLRDERLIWHRWSFLLWSRLNRHSAVRPGLYTLSPKLTGRSMLKMFLHGPPMVRVTFPEGWTARQMAASLGSKAVTSPDEFLKLVADQKAEGYLFPDTYFFEQGIAAQTVINRLKSRFDEKKPTDFAESAKAMRLTETQLVTLASLVEKEARVPDERPIIAGVFLNRLKKHWRLESCATVQYSLGTWKPRLTYEDLDVESPYNTYRHAGLPPGPIANPGAASLEAAAHPAKTDAMFFVAEGGGTHRFSRYYKEHLDVQREMHKKR